jgi:hypothetical protein
MNGVVISNKKTPQIIKMNEMIKYLTW